MSPRRIILPASLLTVILSLVAHMGSGAPLAVSSPLHYQQETGSRFTFYVIDTTDTRIINGVIKDAEDGSLLYGIQVNLKGSNIGTFSDASGKFSLVIPVTKDPPVLIFSFIGFKTMERTLLEDEPILYVELEQDLSQATICLTGPRRWSPRGIWMRIRNAFR